MSDFVLHVPDNQNRILRYRCGLEAGQTVTLKKELVMRDHKGRPHGVVHSRGEKWRVLPGITSDPVLWFRQADGNRCTWDDDPQSVNDWFTADDLDGA